MFEEMWHFYYHELKKPIQLKVEELEIKTIRPYITEKLLMGCKESNQTN